MKKYLPFVWIGAALLVIVLMSIKRGPGQQAWEFARNMYDDVGYEPLKQTELNTINPFGMNMRAPVAGTVPRQTMVTTTNSDTTNSKLLEMDNIARTIHPDSMAVSEALLVNPIPLNETTLGEGQVLYTRYCVHCHGENGKGDGLVGKVYKGVPVYSSDALKNLNDGHIFHTITHGKGRMWPHGSQMTPEERWKIVHYVHKLQQEP